MNKTITFAGLWNLLFLMSPWTRALTNTQAENRNKRVVLWWFYIITHKY